MKIESRHIQSLNREITYLVGTNAQDNFDIIDESDEDDLWFHISDYSSCHVIAKMPQDITLDKKQKLQIIKQGALICKQNSKYKSEPNLDIIYTNISNVIKTNVIGQVQALNVKHIII
jgi:predicted ribosome quality control (RQC) complex YloA/Tae2 family protein